MTMKRVKTFYDSPIYVEKVSATAYLRSDKPFLDLLRHGTVVELGCGIGVRSDLGDRYIGIELSETALRQMKRGIPVCADITRIPLADSIADAVFSVTTLEHVPAPQRVLEECIRILKPGGIVIHDDAWFCRSWTASGITVKNWGECSLREKLLKLSIPVRNARAFRALYILPLRLLREQRARWEGADFELDVGRLEPNLEEPIVSDSDAFASIDPHAVALFYKSRGFELIRPRDAFLARLKHTGYVVCRKPHQ